jgi:hypothetical protein
MRYQCCVAQTVLAPGAARSVSGGRYLLAVVAAIAASTVALVVASVVAMVLMLVLNGFSESQVQPFAIGYLALVAIGNAACAAIVALGVLGPHARGRAGAAAAIAVLCTLLPLALVGTMYWS